MTKTETVVDGTVVATELRSAPRFGCGPVVSKLTKRGTLTIEHDQRQVTLEPGLVPELIVQLRAHGLLPSPPVSA